MTVGVREDQEPGPPQAGLVVFPGLAALADARPTADDARELLDSIAMVKKIPKKESSQ